MVAFAKAPQSLIQGFSPAAPVAGMTGKLVEGLAQKLRASPAPVHPALFAALLGDRRNAKQLLRLLGGLKAIPIRAKGRHQARGQDCTRPRKTVKQGAIGMLAKKRRDLAVKAIDGPAPSNGCSCWTSAATIIAPDSRAAGSVVRG